MKLATFDRGPERGLVGRVDEDTVTELDVPSAREYFERGGAQPTTGTVPGVAAFRADPHEYYLRPGDVVEAEIDGVGLLRNPIVSWREAHGREAGG